MTIEKILELHLLPPKWAGAKWPQFIIIHKEPTHQLSAVKLGDFIFQHAKNVNKQNIPKWSAVILNDIIDSNQVTPHHSFTPTKQIWSEVSLCFWLSLLVYRENLAVSSKGWIKLIVHLSSNIIKFIFIRKAFCNSLLTVPPYELDNVLRPTIFLFLR